MKIKLKITQMDIVALLVFIPLCKRNSFESLFPLLDSILDISKIAICVILFIMYFIEEIKPDIFMISLFMIEFINGIATLFNQNGTMWLWGVSTATNFSIYFFIQIFVIRKKVNSKAILFFPKFIIYLNILSFFIWPNGMYTSYDGTGAWYSDLNWLLGTKNTYLPFFLSTMLLSIKDNINKNGHLELGISNILLSIACVFNIFVISKSATGMIGIVMLFAFFMIQNLTFMKSKKMIWVYIGIIITSTIFLLFYFEDNYLVRFISYITSKSITFTGRKYFWQKSISSISRKKIIGYGLETPITIINRIGQTTCHNKYLQTLYQGGFLSGFFALLIIVVILQKFYQNYQYQIVRFLAWLFFIILIIFEVESLDKSRDVMVLLTMFFYWDKIFPQTLKKKSQ